VLPDREHEHPSFKFDNKLSPNPPDKLYNAGKYNFGRWNKAVPHPNIHNISLTQHITQKKEWQFMAFYNGKTFIGVAVGQLNYIGTAFVYVLEDQFADQKTTLLPLGMGAVISSSSISGCTTWYDAISRLNISLCNHDKSMNVKIQGHLNGGKEIRVDAVLDTSNTESLVLSYPIGPHRVAYSHKQSAIPLQGTFQIGDKVEKYSDQSLALLDWTRSMQRRLTVWYWVAMNFYTNGKRIGINLSHGVYPQKNEKETLGLENAIWVDGKVSLVLSELRVTGEPGNKHVQMGQEWKCSTADGSIFLKFVPSSATVSDLNVGIINAKLIHTFGTYNGFVKVDGIKYEIKNVTGILEDHWALW
jgi:hypothetical protein